MHVGSGETNFNIIDNEIQRDVITGYPTIHSSSLKGAIKAFFNSKGEEDTSDFIAHVFGNKERAGIYKFFGAYLLSFPVRSNKGQFFRATCPAIIKGFLTFAEDLQITISETKDLEVLCKNLELEEGCAKIFEDIEGVKIEGIPAVHSGIEYGEIVKEVFGENVAVFTDEDFNDIMKKIPFIARNCLENGISQNLWYEEIIPRETRFYFAVLHDKEYKYGDKFEDTMLGDIVQIGANASIGYGYTRIKSLPQQVGENHE